MTQAAGAKSVVSGGSGGGSGTIADTTSTGATIAITNPTGPVTNFEAVAAITQASGDNTSKIATDAFVQLAILNGAVSTNILQYGAAGGGVIDATSAINAALGAAPPGWIVDVPADTFLISGEIVIPDYVTLRGTRSRSTSGQTANKGSLLLVANAANLNAIIADAAWDGNSTSTGNFKCIDGISINGNAANQTSGTGIGIVGMSYRFIVDTCTVTNTRGDGIRLTSAAKNGTVVTSGTAVENRIIACTLDTLGVANLANNNSGIAIRDTGALVTDGFITHCAVFSGTTITMLYGIFSNQSAGWLFDGNHIYGSGSDGMHILTGNFTRVVNNYCEFWGQTSGLGAVYGIFTNDTGSGGGTIVTGNQVNMNQAGVTGNAFTAIATSSNATAGYYTIGPNTISSTAATGTGFATLGAVNGNYIVNLSPQVIVGLTAPYSILSQMTLLGTPFAIVQSPAFSAIMEIDLSLGTTIVISPTSNFTLQVPKNLYAGAVFTIIFLMQGGGWNVTYANTGGTGQWLGVNFNPNSASGANSAGTFTTDGFNILPADTGPISASSLGNNAAPSATTGTKASVPPTSATIQTALGTLALGTAFRNTLSYDVKMTVYLSITVNTSGVVKLGVGTTNTPTQTTIITGVTTVGFVPITFTIPAGQFALLSISGTVTDSIAGQYLEAA